MHRIFLLSPARMDGARARLLFNPGAEFDLAGRLRSGQGATLGEVMAFTELVHVGVAGALRGRG